MLHIFLNLCNAKNRGMKNELQNRMKNENKIDKRKNIDDEIQLYIERKKEENSALKKLLNALNNSKKSDGVKNHE